MSNELIGGLSTAGVLVLTILAIIYQKFKPLFHQDRFYVTIITSGKKLERHFVAPKSENGVTGFFFKHDRTGYQVDNACVVNGQFNTPTLMYKKGFAAPLNLNSDKLEFSTAVSDKDFYEGTQNNIASDLMRSIAKPASMMLMVLIIVGAVAAGAIYVNMQSSKKFEKIEKQIAASQKESPFADAK